MVAVVLYLSSSTHSLAYSLIQSTEDRLRHTLLLLDVEGAIAEAGTCFGMRAPPGARTKRNGKTMDIQQFTAWVQEQNPAEYKSQDAQPIVLGQYVPYVEQKDQILQRAKWFSKLDSVFSSFLSSNEHQGQHFDLYSLLRDVMDTHNVRCFKFSHGGNECWAPAECAGVHLKEVKIQLPVHRVTQEEIGQGPDMHRDGWCMLPWSYGPAHFPSLCSALTSLYGQPRVRVDYNAGMQELFVEVFAGVADGSLPKLLLIFERGHLEEGEVAYEYTDQAEWDLSDEWVEPEPFT